MAAIIEATVMVLSIAIIIRALLSWVPNLVDPRGPVAEFFNTITDPILVPIRSVMPRGMMIDFSPIVAIFLLQIIGRVLIEGTA